MRDLIRMRKDSDRNPDGDCNELEGFLSGF
jgi:hypothetical protein